MKNRILWIRAVANSDLDDTIKSFLDAAKEPQSEIKTVSLQRGPQHVEYRYYEALVLPDILYHIKRAEADGFDGAVVACFFDLGLVEAREITQRLVLTGPAEAALHIAATLGHRFSIISGRRKWTPQLNEVVARCGLSSKLASVRPVGLGVTEFRADLSHTENLLTEAARKAVVDDGAEVILLGCAMEFGFYQTLQERLGVPVIDPLLAPLKYLEFLIGLKKRFGWGHSKVGAYEGPPREELARWRLEEQYSFKGFSR